MNNLRTENMINPDADVEESLKPLVVAADDAAKEFVASLVVLMQEGEKAMSEKLAECQQAFAKALVKGWRMMLANEIAYNFITSAILVPPAEGVSDGEHPEESN